MKIGLYFGSFNPIHVGHLIIASHIADSNLVDKVWFVVSPQNPLKPSTSLLNEYHRLHLVQLAIENDNRLAVSNIEFNLPKPSYTIDTLAYLSEKYPQHIFRLILGSDSFNNLPKWKNHKQLIENQSFIVYPRPGFEVNIPKNVQATVIEAPLLSLSSTVIRKNIKNSKSIRYLVVDAVREEIERNGYYK